MKMIKKVWPSFSDMERTLPIIFIFIYVIFVIGVFTFL